MCANWKETKGKRLYPGDCKGKHAQEKDAAESRRKQKMRANSTGGEGVALFKPGVCEANLPA